jgi:hypothetical protein
VQFCLKNAHQRVCGSGWPSGVIAASLRRAQSLLLAAQLPWCHLDNSCAVNYLDHTFLLKVNHVLAPTFDRLLNHSLLPGIISRKTRKDCASDQRVATVKARRFAARWRP